MSPHKKSDLLKQGTLELLVLRLLRAGPLNGWDIMQRIRVASGEVLSVTPGALYPALHRLEERGLVSARWAASGNNRRAKLYELTRAGARQLEEERETWERFSGAVEALLRDA
jgi:PadR family transcriptional regulator PadR